MSEIHQKAPKKTAFADETSGQKLGKCDLPELSTVLLISYDEKKGEFWKNPLLLLRYHINLRYYATLMQHFILLLPKHIERVVFAHRIINSVISTT